MDGAWTGGVDLKLIRSVKAIDHDLFRLLIEFNDLFFAIDDLAWVKSLRYWHCGLLEWPLSFSIITPLENCHSPYVHNETSLAFV